MINLLLFHLPVLFASVTQSTSDSLMEMRQLTTWFRAGAGLGETGDPHAGMALVFPLRGNWGIGVRVELSSQETTTDVVGESVWEACPLITYSPWHGVDGMVGFGGGIGVMGGAHRKEEGYENFVRVGVGVDAQATLYFSPAIGASLVLLGNLNTERSFAAALFCLQLRYR